MRLPSHYHFRSSDALLEALLANRQQPVMELRRRHFRAASRKGGDLLWRALTEALVMPFAQPILT